MRLRDHGRGAGNNPGLGSAHRGFQNDNPNTPFVSPPPPLSVLARVVHARACVLGGARACLLAGEGGRRADLHAGRPDA